MKTIPPPCPEPEYGRKYWRSLDDLAQTPEFRTWMEQEFPQGASEWTDPVSRRHFVKIMSDLSMAANIGGVWMIWLRRLSSARGWSRNFRRAQANGQTRSPDGTSSRSCPI